MRSFQASKLVYHPDSGSNTCVGNVTDVFVCGKLCTNSMQEIYWVRVISKHPGIQHFRNCKMKFALAASIFTLVVFVTNAYPTEEGKISLPAELPMRTAPEGNPG